MKKILSATLICLTFNLSAQDIPEILGDSTRVPIPNQQNTQFYFEHPTFGLIQQRKKKLSDELKEAGFGLALATARDVIAFEYRKWREGNPEMDAAQSIEIHNALEQRLENLREKIIELYGFLRYTDEITASQLVEKISNALSKTSRKKIKLITCYLSRLNSIKAKYEFEEKNNLEQKNETLTLFVNIFEDLLNRL